MGEEAVQGSSPSEEKVFVSVRVRPLNEKEITRYEVPDWECINDNTIIYRNNLSVSERSMYSNAYMFDKVFGPDCSTRKVYEEGAKEVALSVASGINASVFAYGQTSSGKTYTMSGITEYAIADIYNYIERHKEREFLLKLSAMEIYNEAVRDLLSADTTPLRLLDDPERGTIVEKLTEETLRDWSHFQELLSVCEAQRQIGETALNETSSRSHQILRLTIESSAREFLGKDGSSILTATVNFVDLAGSERASQSLSAGARLKEGCHINRSLLTLGTVIRKLSKGRSGHIPFRDSKLTRILQSSLGGNSRTSIICTMSPARCHVEQSRNTLLFASCAKEVTTNAQVNVVMSDKALVKQLQRELARLEDQIKSPGVAPVTSDTATLLREKDLQIEKLKNEIKQLTMQQEVVKSEVEDLRRLVGDSKSTMESESNNYPKLRVRRSWGFENPSPYTPISVDPQSMEIGAEGSYESQYSDAQSSTVSEEHRVRIPDFEVNSSQSESDHSIHPPIRVPNLASGSSISRDESEECSDGDNSEDFCKVVRCIETEPERSNWDLDDSTSDRVPVPEMTSHIRSDDEEEENSKDLTTIEDDGQDKGQTESPNLKENIQNNDLDTIPYAHLCPSPEKTSEMPQKKEISDFHTGQFKLSRSRSCNAVESVLDSSKVDIEENHSMPTKIYKEESTGSPEICQQKIPPSKHSSPKPLSVSGRDAELEEQAIPQVSTDEKRYSFEISTNDRPQLKCGGATMLSSSSEDFERNAPSIELEHSSAQVGTDDKRYSFEVSSSDRNDSDEVFLDMEHQGSSNSVPDSSNAFSLSEDTQYTNHKEIELRATGSTKSVRDVGLDPMQDDYLNSPRRSPFEFKRVQREIIRLWDECNVLLVHRTYFYLLVKDDPADSVYMEVEMRRLSFLREMFSRGNQIRDDDRAVSAASSVRDLRRERQMLSKQMHKKLTSVERETLYVAWGINLDTRNRSLQVAYRLWTDTEDDSHIGESASIVAKLVGFAPSEQTSKEMFGLNFAPRRSTSRSLSVFRKTMMMLTGNLQ